MVQRSAGSLMDTERIADFVPGGLDGVVIRLSPDADGGCDTWYDLMRPLDGYGVNIQKKDGTSVDARVLSPCYWPSGDYDTSVIRVRLWDHDVEEFSGPVVHIPWNVIVIISIL
jgi:hypothetical protein